MLTLDIDELKTLTLSLAGKTIRVVRNALENSKMGVKNKEELESFDLQVLPSVMQAVLTYLDRAAEKGDSLDVRAKAYVEALSFYQNKPHAFERQLILVDAWREHKIEHEKFAKKQVEDLAYFKKHSAWSESANQEATLVRKLRDQKEELDKKSLSIGQDDYKLFLITQASRLAEDASQILDATRQLLDQKHLGPSSLLPWRTRQEERQGSQKSPTATPKTP